MRRSYMCLESMSPARYMPYTILSVYCCVGSSMFFCRQLLPNLTYLQMSHKIFYLCPSTPPFSFSLLLLPPFFLAFFPFSTQTLFHPNSISTLGIVADSGVSQWGKCEKAKTVRAKTRARNMGCVVARGVATREFPLLCNVLQRAMATRRLGWRKRMGSYS